MVEWYLRVITIDHDEHTLTSHLPHPVRAKLVAKHGYFWILCLYLRVRRISWSVICNISDSHKSINRRLNNSIKVLERLNSKKVGMLEKIKTTEIN